MPLYDYKCETCGKTFEYRQSINDEPLTTAPAGVCDCAEGQGKVHRILSSNIGLVFKGSGFYLTDYAKSSTSAADSNGHSKVKSEASNGAASPCASCDAAKN
ncbi:MAG: FmdB family zinc ribbon protein [Candidatus Kapaibacterium sp.]